MKKTLVALAVAGLAACTPKTTYSPENPLSQIRPILEASTDAIGRVRIGVEEKECTVTPGLPSLVYVGGEKEKMDRVEMRSYIVSCNPGVLTISYGSKGSFVKVDIEDRLNTQFPSSLHLVMYNNQPLHVKVKTTGPRNGVDCVGTPLEENFVRCINPVSRREQLPARRTEITPYAGGLLNAVKEFVSGYESKRNGHSKGKSKGN